MFTNEVARRLALVAHPLSVLFEPAVIVAAPHLTAAMPASLVARGIVGDEIAAEVAGAQIPLGQPQPISRRELGGIVWASLPRPFAHRMAAVLAADALAQ
jgi:hypothetical protein